MTYGKVMLVGVWLAVGFTAHAADGWAGVLIASLVTALVVALVVLAFRTVAQVSARRRLER